MSAGGTMTGAATTGVAEGGVEGLAQVEAVDLHRHPPRLDDHIVIIRIPMDHTMAQAAPIHRAPLRKNALHSLALRRRQGRVGLMVVGIVVVFLLGLFSLSQTVRVSATDFDLDRLMAARSALQSNERDLIANLSRLGSEPAIRQQALDAGLGQLVDPLVVPAR